MSREDTKPKPAPDPIFLLSKKMNIHTDHLLMVGDYKYDIICGKAAGTKTVLLRYKEYIETEINPDFEINSIREEENPQDGALKICTHRALDSYCDIS